MNTLRTSTSRLVQSSSRRCLVNSNNLSRAFSTSQISRENFGEADPELFEKQVVKGKKLTVVDFHAGWLDPILARVMDAEQEADYMKIDTENQQELAAKYKVTALPTVIAFKHGKELSRFVGLVNEEAVKNFVANAKDH
ncbi:thioredoxin-like protein [Cystobasidium minutum MCA 4210]|uniref:thioredoxin-like protein n=1 Tax=Cystobasidium minutum MCA 4210 TaxID=1397322 RepID=UPI0034CFFF46|eukprot:jgi/Rhomi1/195025/gm1.3239_g